MATKKKGCGFLIAALLLLIIGGVAATIFGKEAFSTGKEFISEIEKTGKNFVTPESVEYTTEEDSEVTVWLSGESTEDISKVVIHITEAATNRTSVASQPSGSSHFGNKHLIATFSVEQGKTYSVRASGIEDGRHFTIAAVSTHTALSIAGKVGGAFASLGICGLLALIFGIIGLVKFFGSNNAPAQAPPTDTPGPPPAM